MTPHKSTCPFELTDEGGADYGCDLDLGHEGQHICYGDEGESRDASLPWPDSDDPDGIDPVRYSVRWPDVEGDDVMLEALKDLVALYAGSPGHDPTFVKKGLYAIAKAEQV